MSQVFNLYCDESCHLENDHQPVMVLGTVWCLQDKARETAVRLREIKTAHGLPPDFEVKWTKVSPAKLGFYMDVLNYFFDDDDLHFRAWVAHKAGLRHGDPPQVPITCFGIGSNVGCFGFEVHKGGQQLRVVREEPNQHNIETAKQFLQGRTHVIG